MTCRRCGNHCARTVIAFGDGSLYVTGNRCPRGEEISWDELTREVPTATPPRQDPKAPRRAGAGARGVPVEPAAVEHKPVCAANLFDERARLLFQDWPCEPVTPNRNEVIGIPRVLAVLGHHALLVNAAPRPWLYRARFASQHASHL